MHHRLKTLRRLVLPLALFALLATEATPAAGRGRARARSNAESPGMTLSRFKRAFARNDHGAEWATLSPGFKRRINKMAGRVVDVGDYTAMRSKYRNDPRLRELRQWLPSAGLSRIRYKKDRVGYADVTIRFGAPIVFGQDVRVVMVKHELWELYVHGESDPYWGFTDDKKIRVFRTKKENDYVVETRDKNGKVTWRNRMPASKVKSYRVLTRWYFDSFGKMEQEFTGKLK